MYSFKDNSLLIVRAAFLDDVFFEMTLNEKSLRVIFVVVVV